MNITAIKKEICRLKQKYNTLGGIIMANISANKNVESVDYSAIEAMESFNKFVKKKNTFLFSITAAFLILYILLPILAFQPVLQQKNHRKYYRCLGLFSRVIHYDNRTLYSICKKKLLHSIKLQQPC